MVNVYQDDTIMNVICDYLENRKKDYKGSFLIRRNAFRWSDEDGNVMPNHYESQDIYYLAESFNYEILINFNHAALVRKIDDQTR